MLPRMAPRGCCGSFAAENKRLKVILNARNFGHIRSPYHALMQTTGEAVIGPRIDPSRTRRN